jgi:hypothetical protein
MQNLWQWSRKVLSPPRMLDLAEEVRRLAGTAETAENRLALEELALRYVAEVAGLDPR